MSMIIKNDDMFNSVDRSANGECVGKERLGLKLKAVRYCLISRVLPGAA